MAVKNAGEVVKDLIDTMVVDEFYNDYHPTEYRRMKKNGGIKGSLDIGDLTKSKTGKDGYEIDVYFDVGKLDHPRTTGGYTRGQSGKYHKAVWTEGEILSTAMEGEYPHGGYVQAGGTPMWPESIGLLNELAASTLKSELIAAGVPVK